MSNSVYVSYCDRNYFIKFLVMKNSLKFVNPQAEIWLCCLDQSMLADEVLAPFLEDVYVFGVEDVEREYPEVLSVKPHRLPVEYYWTLTPYISHYMFTRTDKNIVYVDVDLKFYADPSKYTDKFAGDVLIHEHRFADHLLSLEKDSGKYNVGLLAFKHVDGGERILRWWQERCLEWCFLRNEPGKLGDQMYLEHFHLVGNVYVENANGFGVAPWNAVKYDLKETETGIDVSGQELVFYHYHALDIISEQNRLKFILSKYPVYKLGNTPELLYKDYIREYVTYYELLHGPLISYEII